MNISSSTGGNVSLSCTLASPNTATKLGLTVAYAVVFIVALFGNCAIILIAKTKRRIRKVAFNFFIISMATADIMDALFSVPLTVLYFYNTSLWFGGLLGDISCKILQFLNSLSLAASVFTLAAISVDRYLAIVHVLREPLSKKKVKLVVVSLWLLASLLMSTYLVKYKVVQSGDGRHYCIGVWVDDRATDLRIYQYETVIRFIFMYVIPLVLMAVLYSLIIRVLKRRQAFGENMSQIRIQHQNVTVIKMLVTVVLIFVFCWIPTHVASLTTGFSYEKLLCWPISLTLALFVPSHANSAINPCIYLIFNENFRKGLKDLLIRCRRKVGNRQIPTRKIKQWPGSSTLERDPNRGGIKGYFRHLSKEKTTYTDDVYDTRL